MGLIILARKIYLRHRVSAENINQASANSGKKELKVFGPVPAADYQLPQSITNTDEDTLERGDWVIRLTSHVFSQRYSGRYNVLTIYNKIDHHFMPEGLVEKISSTYSTAKKPEVITFDTFVFRKGYLIRLGDGGYLNWCFEGNFDRLDNQVVFKEIL